MSQTKNILFTIDGFEVEDNKVYLVAHKKDLDAPTGMVKEGASVLPSDGVGRMFSFRCPGGIWDTGFHPASECYKGWDPKDVDNTVKMRVKNILRPFQKAIGEETCLENTNQASLDKPRFLVVAERAFHTANPVHRMELYAALLGKKLAPKELEKDPKYRLASFTVQDVTRTSKKRNEESISFVRAIRKFENMYKAAPESLKAALIWNNMGGFAEGNDIDTLSAMFSQKVMGDSALAGRFLDAIDNIEGEKSGYLKYFIHEKLVRMRGKNSKFTVGGNGKLYFDGTDIGADIKTASYNLATNPDFAAYKDEILTNGKVVASQE